MSLKKFRRYLKRRRILNAPVYKQFEARISPVICDSRCAISLPEKFIYFRIPKAANSTVTASLHFSRTGHKPSNWREMDRIKKSYTPPSRLSRRQTSRVFEQFYKFTIVRDPYSRLVSGYLDKIVGAEGPYIKMVSRFLGVSPQNEISLSDFVTFLEHEDNRDSDPHWCQQTDLIFIPVEQLDFIGKFENLDHDLAAILHRLYPENHQPVDWIPHATSASEKVRQLVDETLAARIAKLYQKDFELLGYSKTIHWESS